MLTSSEFLDMMNEDTYINTCIVLVSVYYDSDCLPIVYLIKWYFLPCKASGGKPVTLQRSGSLSSTKVDLPEEFKEICNLGTMKQSPATGARVKSNEQAIRKSFIAPNIVPRDTPDGKVSAKSEKETITFSKTKPGMLLRPAHVRRASTGRFDVDRFSEDVNSGTFCDTAIKLDSTKEPKFQPNLGSQNEVKESCEDKHPIKSVTDKFDKTLSPSRFSEQTKCKLFH